MNGAVYINSGEVRNMLFEDCEVFVGGDATLQGCSFVRCKVQTSENGSVRESVFSGSHDGVHLSIRGEFNVHSVGESYR